jgi:Right handed beta helix region
MHARRLLRVWLLAVALGCAGSQAALAVDGVVEINQARVDQGDISPGDRPGFPVSITAPGSYRLTGDLTENPQSGPMVVVDASNVTLDLNGFSLIGSAACGAAGGNCIPAGSAGFEGVYANIGAHNLSVLHGVIRGMVGAGLDLQGLSARLVGVRAVGNANGGAQLGPYCVLSEVTAIGNGADGIRVDQGCSVSGSLASGNHDDGIEVTGPAGGGSTVRENVAVGNGGRGIAVCGGALVSDNEVSRNVLGIEIGAGNALSPGCASAVGEVRDNRVVGNADGVFVSYGASARVVDNSIIGNQGTGLKVDNGLISLQAFAAYGGNVIRGNGSVDVSVGDIFFGFADTLELAPNVCGTDKVCP